MLQDFFSEIADPVPGFFDEIAELVPSHFQKIASSVFGLLAMTSLQLSH